MSKLTDAEREDVFNALTGAVSAGLRAKAMRLLQADEPAAATREQLEAAMRELIAAGHEADCVAGDVRLDAAIRAAEQTLLPDGEREIGTCVHGRGLHYRYPCSECGQVADKQRALAWLVKLPCECAHPGLETEYERRSKDGTLRCERCIAAEVLNGGPLPAPPIRGAA